jgi:glycosyltransferase involved in cell wall biosynthesis
MHGWRPTVLTVDPTWATNRDDGLLAEVPGSLGVVRTRSFEPRPAARMPGGDSATLTPPQPSPLRRQLGHLKRVPDAHLGWLPFAVAAGLRQHFDVIYSSSGPFTSHVVGWTIQRVTGRPWVAELRDGWYQWNRAIFPDYPAWRAALEPRLESTVIRSASRVVLVTERMAEAFRRQYAELPSGHFGVVSNGFDPAQFTTGPAERGDHSFEVVHAGALYYGRSLTSFLRAAARLVDTDADFAAAFKLTLLGTLDAAAHAELRHSARGERVRLGGQVDHAATLRAMRAANLLLLIANTTPGAEATVPGKVFEYLAAGRPVLAIAPSRESSTADVLAQTGAGWLAEANDIDQIACTLREAFAAHRAGRPYRPNPQAIARYDRRVLTGQLAAIFDDVRAAHRL